MLIFGINIELNKDIKLFLSSHFEMKDIGEADIILGVKIRKNKNGLSLSQSHYVENLPVKTPYDASKHLKKNKRESVSQPEYAKIISSVMYLMNYTRPDIAYAVSRLDIHIILLNTTGYLTSCVEIS